MCFVPQIVVNKRLPYIQMADKQPGRYMLLSAMDKITSSIDWTWLWRNSKTWSVQALSMRWGGSCCSLFENTPWWYRGYKKTGPEKLGVQEFSIGAPYRLWVKTKPLHPEDIQLITISMGSAERNIVFSGALGSWHCYELYRRKLWRSISYKNPLTEMKKCFIFVLINCNHGPK